MDEKQQQRPSRKSLIKVKMCDIRRITREKFQRWKKKHTGFSKKNTEIVSSVRDRISLVELDPIQYIGYFECKRRAPSSNTGVFAHMATSVESQTAELMLNAFRRTLTPMDFESNWAGNRITWIELLWRGQLPLDKNDHGGFHVPKRLQQTLNSSQFTVTVDADFEGTIAGCASTTGENRRNITWINSEIRRLMIELHRQGHAHSVEVWQNEKLVGGLYGVSLGAYFTIESQFSFAKDASKVALVHLVARLRLGGYRMLDIDEITMHLSQFGAYELFRDEFLIRMKAISVLEAIWLPNDTASEVIRTEIQRLIQMTKQSVHTLSINPSSSSNKFELPHNSNNNISNQIDRDESDCVAYF